MAFEIAIEQPVNGSISVYNSDGESITELEAGETAYVECVPSNGYVVVCVLANDELVTGGMLVMPEKNVTVTAEVVHLDGDVEVDLDQVVEAAENTQYFWTDDDGAHVTDMPQDEWTAARDAGFPDISDAKPYANSLWTSLAMLFRTGLNNLVSIGRGAVEFFDGLGNDAANVVASFGREGTQIGRAGESRVMLDYHSLELIDSSDEAYFQVYDMRDTSGEAVVVEDYTPSSPTTSIPLTFRATSVLDVQIGGASVQYTVGSMGYSITLANQTSSTVTVKYKTKESTVKAIAFGSRSGNTGPMSMSGGVGCESSGLASCSSGYESKASGTAAHAEGYTTNATGRGAHAEGIGTGAGSYDATHAEGYASKAVGKYSHAQNDRTNALGESSHAEGSQTWAQGAYSHAQGVGTNANRKSQTAIGEYNKIESGSQTTRGDYVLVVGNGTSGSNRSNAFALKWDGTLVSADKAGITQTVAIGDKTLTITGGIITGIS